MKQTKEELLLKIGELEKALKERVEYGERVRKEFSKAFRWYDKKGVYEYEDKLKLPSWEEIFTELGKLLSLRDFRDYEGNISELEYKLEDLESKIRKEIHPNL